MKKRIILMYISEVSGHHSATIAIEKALRILDPTLEILNINAFKYTNPIAEKVVNQIYTTVIKSTPKIWDYVYDNPVVKKKLDYLKDMIHKFNSKKFVNLFNKFNPDIVVCAQAFPCGMVADYKKFYNKELPLMAVLTDFVPHAYWVYENVDCYVAPSVEVAQKLTLKGVAEDKVKSLGIPFDSKFNAHVNKSKVYAKLGLDAKIKTILIMGGGQGLGPIKTIVKSLEKADSNFQEIVVTGTNKKLYKSLKKKIKKYKKKIVLLGYCDNVNELMSIADMIVTKPGGITTSEALSKKLPILIIKPIPGQEANNTKYLTEQGAALKINKPKEINLVVDDLVTNPDKLHSLSKSAGKIGKPNSSMDIAKLILSF